MSRPAPTTRIVRLSLTQICRERGTQGRAAISPTVVDQYVALMRAGVEFPPVTVWTDGFENWLTDGFHRVIAAERLGWTEITAEVRPGSLEEARWDSFSANTTHGLPRSRADIKHLVSSALRHPKATPLSTNQIAKHLGLPEATVRRWRNRLLSEKADGHRRSALRGGKAYEISISQIGKSSAPQRQIKKRIDLQNGLGNMKSLASSDLRRVLNVLGNWLFGTTTTADCADAMEKIIEELKASNRKAPHPRKWS